MQNGDYSKLEEHQMNAENKKSMLSERIPWNGTRLLTFYDIHGNPYQREIKIERVIGMGASCICYAVEADFGNQNIHKMILKQFCPEPTVTGEEKKHLALLFEQAYELQNHLANTDSLMDLIVRPYEKYFSDEERYILYEANYGDSLEKREIKDLKTQLQLMRELAAALQRLHACGIIHMDLKPENILWTAYGGIKFFDFDAAIILNQLDDVHEIRGDLDRPGLLAPELKDLSEFEQNKRLFLHPRVDIYAVGAMLFHWFLGYYPTGMEGEADIWKCQLQELFEHRFRGKLNGQQQELLVHILKKSTSVSIGRKGRYRHAGDMAADLNILLQSMQSVSDVKKRDQICEVNYRLLAAYFLWKHPLYSYVSENADGSKAMDVVLYGASPMREAFLVYIFSSARMPGVSMRIHVVAEDAAAFARSLLCRYPQLKTTVEMCCEGKWQPFELDTGITAKPFANLYFYTCKENTESFTQWFYVWKQWMTEQYGEQSGIALRPYLLINTSNEEENYRIADQFNRCFDEHAREYISGCFLGYGDDRGDGYHLRKQGALSEQLEMDVFGMNAKYSVEEKDFSQDIGKFAFLLHTYYAREWNPAASEEALWKDFSNNPYQINSSIRSALAVPYKLFCAGIRMDENASEQFRRMILEQKSEDPKSYYKVLAMEHESWLCFLMMEGYQHPTEKVLRKYAFSGRNDQRDRPHKLHPCISEFDEEKGMPLSEISREEWDRLTREGPDHGAWDSFDALDRVSLLLHQISEQKTKRLDLSAQFEKLKDELELEEAKKEVFQALYNMEAAYQEMMAGSVSANSHWEQCCNDFAQALQQMEAEQGLYDEEIKDAFGMIREDMRVVWERNLYHDYKKSDESILCAIPELLKHWK